MSKHSVPAYYIHMGRVDSGGVFGFLGGLIASPELYACYGCGGVTIAPQAHNQICDRLAVTLRSLPDDCDHQGFNWLVVATEGEVGEKQMRCLGCGTPIDEVRRARESEETP